MIRPAAMPPKEALAFWKDKTPVTRAEFDALDKAAKSRAFTVSGLARQDQIGFVQTQIFEAMQNGETLADFKKRIPELIKAQGWTGHKAWRVENLFRTNTQSAFMAGRYAQMKRVANSRPFWKYHAINDSRTRDTHRALHGMVYRHDHPFWSQFYPPNGYACRCTVQTLSERQVKARGLKVQEDMPERIMLKDSATEAEKFVRPLPDKGWGTNIGEDWLSGLTPEELADKITDLTDRALCKHGRGMFADETCKPPLADLDPRHILSASREDILREGLASEEYVKAFLEEFGLKGLDDSTVVELPGGISVPVSKGFFVDKKSGRWKVEKFGRAPYVKLLARTIQNPFEVWQVPAEVAGKRLPVLRLLRLFSLEDRKVGGFVVFNLIRGRFWQAATAFTPKAGGTEAQLLEYLEKQRAGVLIHREELR